MDWASLRLKEQVSSGDITISVLYLVYASETMEQNIYSNALERGQALNIEACHVI
jgi:hypothetical protein